MWLQREHFQTWRGDQGRRGTRGAEGGEGCILQPSAPRATCRLPGISRAFCSHCCAPGFGKGILEVAATAAFGGDIRCRFVAATTRGTKAHTEASCPCPRTGVADDGWNEGERSQPISPPGTSPTHLALWWLRWRQTPSVHF